MPWIKTIPPEDADGELARLYGTIASARGGVAEIHQIQSLNARAMLAHLELYKRVMFGRSSLSRRARERIAVVVSHTNRCRYCIAHHGETLAQAGESEDDRRALEAGRIPPGLPDAQQVLLRWAQMVTAAPCEATEADVSALREAGFEDAAILDAALTVAYFNFVNRLVLSLGVELESGFEETCVDDSIE